MPFLDRFRRKKEDESSRRARLARTGRMADGAILDAVTDDQGRIVQVTYSYMLAGVQYESSQDLSVSQQEHSDKYAPGKQITIRYDPRQPANSIVV